MSGSKLSSKRSDLEKKTKEAILQRLAEHDSQETVAKLLYIKEPYCVQATL